MPFRLVFMGTPAFSVPCLRQIISAGHDVIAVYTQPPRPAGRGLDEQKSPVHMVAEAHNLPILTPTSLNDNALEDEFLAFESDVSVVVAYGQLLPSRVINGPKFGCYNLHASKLPRWRGAAPIQRAIMSGDAATAVTVMRMDDGLDTGPICLEQRVEIEPNMTAGDLHDHLASRGADLIVEALAELESGILPERPQDSEGITYARKIVKSESKIDFDRGAQDVHNHIRGLAPFPGAWFEVSDGAGRKDRVKVLESRIAQGAGAPGELLDDALTIACGSGAIQLLKVQRAGRRVTSAQEFLRGFQLNKGTIFPS